MSEETTTSSTPVPETASFPQASGTALAAGAAAFNTGEKPVASAIPLTLATVAEPDVGVVDLLTRTLLFGVSLPERILRNAMTLTAGALKETAELLVPRSFQDSKTYEVVVRNSLNFLTQQVGGVQPHQTTTGDGPAAVATPQPTLPTDSASAATPATAAVGEDYLARKVVSNFIDLAGFATLHLSPLWVLAMVSDVAYGTKTYLRELASELQKQGLIDDSSTIHQVDDIFSAVQNATRTAAGAFDQPPFSLDELKKTVHETRESLSSADLRHLFPEAEIRHFWEEMQDLARQEDVSLLGLSGAIMLQTVGQATALAQGTLTGIKVAGGMMDRHVLEHYRQSLAQIRSKGLFTAVKDAYQPYVAAIWTNFSPSKKTLTERLLDPRNITGACQRLWCRICACFGRRQSPDAR